MDQIPTDRITVREDAVIGRAGARDLTGNLFIPPMGTVPGPAMVIVHGGGWARGSPRGVRGFGEHLSQLGFVCLCPSYRLSGLDRPVELHVFAGEGHAFDRRSTTRDGMVDVADPSSVYGQTVLRLIGHFFSKYLESRGG